MKGIAWGVVALALGACTPSSPDPTEPVAAASQAQEVALNPSEARLKLWRLIDTWKTSQDLAPRNLERIFGFALDQDGSARRGSRRLGDGSLAVSVRPEGPNYRVIILFPLPEPGQACVLSIGELVDGLRSRGHEALLSDIHALRQSWSFPSEPRGGYSLSIYALTEPEVQSKDDPAPCVSEIGFFSMEVNGEQAIP